MTEWCLIQCLEELPPNKYLWNRGNKHIDVYTESGGKMQSTDCQINYKMSL